MSKVPIEAPMSKITSAIWGPNEEYILTGHDGGDLNQFDLVSNGARRLWILSGNILHTEIY